MRLGRLQSSVVACALLACGAPQDEPRTGDPRAASSAQAEDARPEVSWVRSEVIVSSCPDAAKMSSKQARLAIERLVEPCTTVPGGAAHFAATLLPGGRIELGSPTGDVAEGVVPTCVLKHQLRHLVLLSKPCMFGVQLEARTGSGAAAPQ